MIKIKKNPFRRKIKFNISLPVILSISAVIIVSTLVFCTKIRLPEFAVNYSSYLVIPESIRYSLSKFRAEIIAKYGRAENQNFIQNSGSINDIIKNSYLQDISETPADVTKTIKKLIAEFEKSEYTTDGTVIEADFSQKQATDSYGNIFLRNITADTEVDIKSILAEDFSIPVTSFSEPLVLIYHTHSTESYYPLDNGTFSSAYPTRNDNKNANMIRVGEEICNILEANGIVTIHDKKIHDKTYTGAYDKSREEVNRILEKYPSIIITLDIHRDAIYYDDTTRIKPTVEINGKKAAQLMIISGAEGGNVTSFPEWRKNLQFALNLQNYVNTDYPSLMKPVFFCNRKYNMDITPYSLLIETGTDVNTIEEAVYSARLLATSLAKLIREKSE